ncbi:MAG: hypothetical protein J5I93_14220 [Pirellulaceae bacterium]|nr:hypothetical protein [Pirellulaceae bacterium]
MVDWDKLAEAGQQNLSGTFSFLITVLDGYSRYIVRSEIRESSKDIDVEAAPRFLAQTRFLVILSN